MSVELSLVHMPPETVYHEHAPGQANGRFGHRRDWWRYCYLCIDERVRRATNCRHHNNERHWERVIHGA